MGSSNKIKDMKKNIKSESDYNLYIIAKDMYKDIIDTIDKYNDVLDHNGYKLFGDTNYIIRKAELHLFGMELRSLGLDINPKEIDTNDWIVFNINNHVDSTLKKNKTSNRIIAWYGDKYNRSISYPVNGNQPKNELLLCIKFPTGAYIFGEDFPENIFNNFFNSLKAYKPDYADYENKSLFWKIENSEKIFNAYPSIYETYRKQSCRESIDNKIALLEKELSILKQKKAD